MASGMNNEPVRPSRMHATRERLLFGVLTLSLLVVVLFPRTKLPSSDVGVRLAKTEQHVLTSSCSASPNDDWVDPNGTWSVTTNDATGIQGWTWHPGPTSDPRYQYHTIWQNKASNPLAPPLPAYPPMAPGAVSAALKINATDTSLVFYGSSHLREVFFALMRLELGLDLAGTLSPNITFLPSGTKIDPRTCDPGRSGYVDGYYGVDLQKCGPPARKILTELGPKVALGFKTFLHTPDADAHFLDFLTAHDLRHPDIVLLDAGIWGSRGAKLGGSARTVWTPQQEWDYYMNWIADSFPHSHIVLFHEGHATILERFERLKRNPNHHPRQQVSILRKDILQQRRPPSMPCGHGCSGPVITTLAVLLVEWLQERKKHPPCNGVAG